VVKGDWPNVQRKLLGADNELDDIPGPRVASWPLFNHKLSSIVVRPKPITCKPRSSAEARMYPTNQLALTLSKGSLDLPDIDTGIDTPSNIHMDITSHDHMIARQHIHLDL